MSDQPKTELTFELVDSTRIHSRAYDAARKVIVLRFPDGSQYEYPDCDERAWKDFVGAKSAGSHLYKQLNKKAYKRIDNWK